MKITKFYHHAILLVVLLFGAGDCLSERVVATAETMDAQIELRSQGFYYGEVDGIMGPETVAAVKRFQIRNGLRVDGVLNAETLQALEVPAPPVLETETRPVLQSVPDGGGSGPSEGERETSEGTGLPEDVVESDRAFLETSPPDAGEGGFTGVEESSEDVSVPQYEILTGGELFAGTSYENADGRQRRNAIVRAQIALARSGHYDADIDGVAGPGTREALARYQSANGLSPTARLDAPTLKRLGVGDPPPVASSVWESKPPPAVYRAIQVGPPYRIYRGRVVE